MNKKRGVIAASAGNHAQALAYQGKLLGIPATVVMPQYAPLIKVNNCQKLGANVVLYGKDFAEAKAPALQIAAEKGLAYIGGYDDPAIIAGQGTMGLGIIEQVPDLDAVIVPVGGAGLSILRLLSRKSRLRLQFYAWSNLRKVSSKAPLLRRSPPASQEN